MQKTPKIINLGEDTIMIKRFKRFLEDLLFTLTVKAEDKAIKQYKQALIADGMSEWAAGIATRVKFRGF